MPIYALSSLLLSLTHYFATFELFSNLDCHLPDWVERTSKSLFH